MEVQKEIEDAVLKDVGDTVPKIEIRKMPELESQPKKLFIVVQMIHDTKNE